MSSRTTQPIQGAKHSHYAAVTEAREEHGKKRQPPRVPRNIVRRPIELPPMEPIKEPRREEPDG